MNFTLLVAVVLFATCAYATPSENKKTLKIPTCKGIDLKLTRDMHSARKKCLVKNFSDVMEKTKNVSLKHRLTCTTVCELRGYGLITIDNIISESSISTFVTKVFPESVTADLIAAITHCVNEKGQNLEVKDRNCESYSPFIKCMIDSTFSICDL